MYNMRVFSILVVVVLAVSCASGPAELSFTRLESDDYSDIVLLEPVVKTVNLGALKVGMTKEQVLNFFPSPMQVDLSSSLYEMWEYRTAQLIFKNGKLQNWFYL